MSMKPTLEQEVASLRAEVERLREARDDYQEALERVERVLYRVRKERDFHLASAKRVTERNIELSRDLDRYREALEHADQVLSRILAPCPRCHTLGRDPGCLTLVHYLPDEARQDIREARSEARAALEGDGNGNSWVRDGEGGR